MRLWPRRIVRGMLSLVPLVLSTNCTEPIQRVPAGSYEATTYLIGPSPAERIDMVAYGVTWTLDVAADGNVVSTTDVKHDELVSHTSRTGSVTLDGEMVWFWGFGNEKILTARTWTLDGDEIVSVDQTVNGMNGTVRFTRR